jgi:hypothetical protein
MLIPKLTKNVCVVLTLMPCTVEVPGLYLDLDTGCPGGDLPRSFSVLAGKHQDTTSTGSELIPSKSFTIHHSPVVLCLMLS